MAHRGLARGRGIETKSENFRMDTKISESRQNPKLLIAFFSIGFRATSSRPCALVAISNQQPAGVLELAELERGGRPSPRAGPEQAIGVVWLGPL
jgi:hypothetical protein